jgi:hypothetical protein
MNNKITIELVWHNCETNPPKEFSNNALIVTNGIDVFGMSWHRADGYLIATECGDKLMRLSELSKWWWADVEQTVQGEPKFRI